MLIVIEGVDGAGKSDLATRLVDALPPNAKLLHRGPPQHHPLVEYAHCLEEYDPSTDHIVCDRWHLGELVYGPLYRGHSELGMPGLRYVDLFLAARGAYVIHVTGDPDVIRRRLVERGEDYLQLDHIEDVIAAFAVAAREAVFARRATTKWPTAHAMDSIDRYLEIGEMLARTAPARDPVMRSYVGTREPDVLLVTDDPDSGPITSLPLPPYRDQCGWWLWETLLDAPTADIGVINTFATDLTKVIDILRPLRIVALGEAGQHRLEELGIEHRYVRHPEWWNRYRYADREGFLQEVFG